MTSNRSHADVESEPSLKITSPSPRTYKTEIFYGETPDDVPVVLLDVFDAEILTSYSGPDQGLAVVHYQGHECPNKDAGAGEVKCDYCAKVAGASSWNKKDEKAYGICISLYDQHPINGRMSGDPIADAFAICARKNNAVLLIADGVNWGEKSKLAARCALYGGMQYINDRLFGSHPPTTTREAVKILRQSLDEAHNTILEKQGGLTTMCACAVLPILDSRQSAVCCVNVGDSYAFVLSKDYGMREVTIGSHDVSFERDIRDAQGAIGPVDGNNPELQNLTCAVTFANSGDLIFLTTDGISDNFDPVVTKVAIPRHHSNPNLTNINEDGIERTQRSPVRELMPFEKPEMEPQERHVYSMKEMERVINEYELITQESLSAQEICGAMVQHVLTLTDPKRKVLENPALYARKKISSTERKRRDSEIVEKMSKAPGKLDHASIVAYEVGGFGDETPEEEETKIDYSESISTGSSDIYVSKHRYHNNKLGSLFSSPPNFIALFPKPKSPKKLFFSSSKSKSPSSTPPTTPTSPSKKATKKPKTPNSLPITPIKKYFRKSHSKSECETHGSTPTTPTQQSNGGTPTGSAPFRIHRRRKHRTQLAADCKRSISYESAV